MTLETWVLFALTEAALCFTPGSQVAILGITSVIIEFFVLLAYGALAARLTSVAARPRFHTLANRVAGTMLVAAGISVARLERA